ncbi:murein DD-endopeptidase MepS/murein LD-carboxypeptidase precursor [Desulfosporosinus acididurans]|uniref:Murein DD-endopeptidase MepS/murein LD-carboxypeptidase n=1 Tax=Desulfosporosinus acididurans TaxID=476652 RepID=A0A0J1FRH4_9FIRM|nr:murein DD-endopeptidase MepS/murein LD-carboxypeptidase precursor [Desulfosporosinus acididurans]
MSRISILVYQCKFCKNDVVGISRDQANIGSAVSYNNLQPGNLVFFSFLSSGTIDHVGIYLGNSQFISATIYKGVTIYSFTPY